MSNSAAAIVRTRRVVNDAVTCGPRLLSLTSPERDSIHHARRLPYLLVHRAPGAESARPDRAASPTDRDLAGRDRGRFRIALPHLTTRPLVAGRTRPAAASSPGYAATSGTPRR